MQPYGELQVALLLRKLALAAAGCHLPTAHVNDRCTAYPLPSSSTTTKGWYERPFYMYHLTTTIRLHSIFISTAHASKSPILKIFTCELTKCFIRTCRTADGGAFFAVAAATFYSYFMWVQVPKGATGRVDRTRFKQLTSRCPGVRRTYHIQFHERQSQTESDLGISN